MIPCSRYLRKSLELYIFKICSGLIWSMISRTESTALLSLGIAKGSSHLLRPGKKHRRQTTMRWDLGCGQWFIPKKTITVEIRSVFSSWSPELKWFLHIFWYLFFENSVCCCHVYGGHSNLQVDWCWPIIGLEVPRLQDLHRPGHGTQESASRSTGWEVAWLADAYRINCTPSTPPSLRGSKWSQQPTNATVRSLQEKQLTFSYRSATQSPQRKGYLPRDTSIAEPGRSLLVLAPSSSTCTWKSWFSSTQGNWWIHDMTNSRKHLCTFPRHIYRVINHYSHLFAISLQRQ